MSPRAAVIALAVLATTSAAATEDKPFASLGISFWHPKTPEFGTDAALMAAPDMLAVSTPCFSVHDAFSGYSGKPRFAFRARYIDRTAVACAPLKEGFDSAEARLRDTAAFSVDDDTLMLKDSNGREIGSFSRIVPDGLEFRWWAITGYRGDRKMVRAFRQNGLKPDILFFNGELMGTPGAGQFEGTYSFKVGRLRVSAGMLCAGGCFGDIIEVTKPQTDAIFKVLKGELTPKTNGSGRYTLQDEQGDSALELTEEKLP